VGKISEFYGIVIKMHVGDHPPPHIHVRYNEFKAKVTIKSGEILKGSLPPDVVRRVEVWRRTNRGALVKRWSKAQAGIQPQWIKGLE